METAASAPQAVHQVLADLSEDLGLFGGVQGAVLADREKRAGRDVDLFAAAGLASELVDGGVDGAGLHGDPMACGKFHDLPPKIPALSDQWLLAGYTFRALSVETAIFAAKALAEVRGQHVQPGCAVWFPPGAVRAGGRVEAVLGALDEPLDDALQHWLHVVHAPGNILQGQRTPVSWIWTMKLVMGLTCR